MQSVDRFFRSYSKYLESYDEDSLFVLLNSLHSLNDRLKAEYEINLFKIDEFIVLKAIRNYIHHQSEMKNCLTSFPATEIMPIQTDLMFMCLIIKSDLDNSIEGIASKFRNSHKEKIENTVHYYGSVVNIGHVIFNMAAKLMDLLDQNSIQGESEEYYRNYECMTFDKENGHSITVSGKLYGYVGYTDDVGEVEGVLLRIINS